jgi:hypothetical protein
LDAGATACFLSGELSPFPVLTSRNPQVVLRIGAASHVLTLAGRPASVEEAAALLSGALATVAAMNGAVVTTLGSRVVVAPPGGIDIGFEPLAGAGADVTTAAELRLAAKFPIRVRVNGAESIDDREVSLP